MSLHSLHFNHRTCALAVMLVPLVSAGGCAMFHKNFWDMDRYRDERAVDIDHRLDKAPPTVKNPFNSEH